MELKVRDVVTPDSWGDYRKVFRKAYYLNISIHHEYIKNMDDDEFWKSEFLEWPNIIVWGNNDNGIYLDGNRSKPEDFESKLMTLLPYDVFMERMGSLPILPVKLVKKHSFLYVNEYF